MEDASSQRIDTEHTTNAATPPPPQPNSDTKPPKTYSCAACGGTTIFSPEAQALKCIYCGNTTPIKDPSEGQEIRENDFDYWAEKLYEFKGNVQSSSTSSDGFIPQESGDTTALYSVTCKQCGATTSINDEHMARRCPFCGTPLVVEEAQLHRFWTPNYLVPFAFSKNGCSDNFRKWAKGKWFAPNKALAIAKGSSQAFSGVYIPYWTYDAHAEADYYGERGDNQERRDNDGRSRTVTVWHRVSGHVWGDFDDIIIPAVDNPDRGVLLKVKDFPQTAYKTFNHAYLAGFVTQAYTIDFVKGADDAMEEIKAVLTDLAKRAIGGDAQRVKELNIELSDKKFKLLVLPFWLASFRYKEKTYQIVINGYCGTVYGKFPVSGWKIFFTVLVTIGVIVGIYYLFR